MQWLNIHQNIYLTSYQHSFYFRVSIFLMFNLVVLNCVLCISSARWCIKPVNTPSISFFINDYWRWYNYSLQLAAIYHFEFHSKGYSIFGCSPGGERKILWKPPLPHLFQIFTRSLTPPHICSTWIWGILTVGTPPALFSYFFANLALHPTFYFANPSSPQGYNKKWNHPLSELW